MPASGICSGGIALSTPREPVDFPYPGGVPLSLSLLAFVGLTACTVALELLQENKNDYASVRQAAAIRAVALGTPTTPSLPNEGPVRWAAPLGVPTDENFAVPVTPATLSATARSGDWEAFGQAIHQSFGTLALEVELDGTERTSGEKHGFVATKMTAPARSHAQ